MYAKKLTKEMLIERGIIDVSKDGKHIYGKLGVEFKQSPSYSGHLLTLGLPVHRIVYAWFNGEATEGLVVDHINNIKTDNKSENLQLLTSGQNIWKDRECNMNQLKCKMNKPRSFYENKLKKYTEIYELAKQEGNAELAHKYRSYIANTNARLRYWDEHKEEYETFVGESTKLNAEKTEMHRKAQYKKEIALWKKYFKATNNKPMWRQLIIIEKDYWDDWSADKIQEKLNLLVTTFPNFEQKNFKEDLN